MSLVYGKNQSTRQTVDHLYVCALFDFKNGSMPLTHLFMTK